MGSTKTDSRRFAPLPERQIADLQEQNESIKARVARKKVTKSHSLRQIRAAVKSIGTATAATDEAVLRTAVNEARTTLSACLSMK